MAGTSMKEDEKKKRDLTEILRQINKAIDQAAATSKMGFSPQLMERFYDTGMNAPKRREELREVTPSRQLGNVVVKKQEEQVALSQVKSQQAIIAGVNCAELIEIACAKSADNLVCARFLNLASWEKKGRGEHGIA